MVNNRVPRFPNVIRDEIPAPREFIQIEYKGPNPARIYRELNQWFRVLWEVKGTQINEPDYRWDITADPRPFFIHLFIERGMDKFTSYRVDVKMQGSQPTDPTKSGVLRVELHGWVETTFPTSTKFNKALFPIFYWPYMVGYYNERRRKYIDWHRRRIERLADMIRESLNIPSRPTP